MCWQEKKNTHKPKPQEVGLRNGTVDPPKGHGLPQVNPSSGCHSLERCGVKHKAQGPFKTERLTETPLTYLKWLYTANKRKHCLGSSSKKPKPKQNKKNPGCTAG